MHSCTIRQSRFASTLFKYHLSPLTSKPDHKLTLPYKLTNRVLSKRFAGLPCRLVARKLGAITTQATEQWNNRLIQGPEEDDDEYEVRMRDFRRMYPNHEDDDDRKNSMNRGSAMSKWSMTMWPNCSDGV